jgi:hypothetical protein
VDKYKSECAIKKYYSMVNDKHAISVTDEITRENKFLVKDICMGSSRTSADQAYLTETQTVTTKP